MKPQSGHPWFQWVLAMSSSATTRGPAALSASLARVASAASAQNRLQSLDVLRGLTIVLMILVNQSGDLAHTYRPLVHAPWNGLTFADVVFPCFLFIVGVSLVLSLSGRVERGTNRPALLQQAFKRAAILFVIGVALNGLPSYHLATLRFYGVLQRIAFCYFVAVFLYLWLKPRTLVLVTAAILLGYYVLLRWVPVPGYGIPGVSVPFLDPHGNLAAWLDRQIFPANHLYLQGFYDPEGLLSSLPALASTLIGVLAGLELLKQKTGSLNAGLRCRSEFSRGGPAMEPLVSAQQALVDQLLCSRERWDQPDCARVATVVAGWAQPQGPRACTFQNFRHQRAGCLCFLGRYGRPVLVSTAAPYGRGGPALALSAGAHVPS